MNELEGVRDIAKRQVELLEVMKQEIEVLRNAVWILGKATFRAETLTSQSREWRAAEQIFRELEGTQTWIKEAK